MDPASPRIIKPKVNHHASSGVFSVPKRRRWLGRWMRRSPPTTDSSACFAAGLELELQELTTALAARNESAGVSSVALMSKESIPVWSSSRGSHDSRSIFYQAVEGFVGDEPHDKERQLYSVKRLSVTKKSAHNKEAIGKALQRLVREASILTKLGDHPNIVSLTALPSTNPLTADQDFFLVTRRLHKETLEDRINAWRKQEAPNNIHVLYTTIYRREGIPSDDDTTPSDDFIPRKSSYAFQIAKAIRACHKAGILLRDLSPANIGFRHDDPHCVQLFELGYAQDTHSSPAVLALDHKEPLCGKRRYMAGEIWTTGEYSYKTDVYSWSLIYWEMCYERKPYRGISATEHHKLVCKGGLRPPLECYCLPHEINTILMRAWEHDPAKRLDIDKVCAKMQRLLVELDTCIVYEENEEDFLFDIHVPIIHDDAVSVVSDDEGQVALATDDLADIESVAAASSAPIEVVMLNSNANWILPACLVAVSDQDLSQCGGDAWCTPSPASTVVVIDPEVHSQTPSCASTLSATPVKMVPSAA